MAGKLDALKNQFTNHADRSLGMRSEVQSSDHQAISIPDHLVGLVKSKDTAEIQIDRIVPDENQPRGHFEVESLERLAESISAQGVLQPLLVRWDAELGRYVLIAGERRWRAAQFAGRTSVPCVIHREALSDAEILVLQLLENLQREDLKPIEQAAGYKKLMAVQGWSANRLSKELAIPVSTVTRALELLDLPPAVQDLVDTGALAPSTACEVGRLEDPEDKVELATQAVEEKLTKANVIEAVRARKAVKQSTTPGQQPVQSKQPEDKGNTNTKAETAQVEIVLDSTHKIYITGMPVGAGPEVALEVLRRGMDKLKAEIASTV